MLERPLDANDFYEQPSQVSSPTTASRSQAIDKRDLLYDVNDLDSSEGHFLTKRSARPRFES